VRKLITLKSLIFSIVLLSLISSCQKADFDDIDPSNESDEYVYHKSHSSDYIYDQNNLHRFDIQISQENLEIINNDPSAEEYVEASLVFEGKIVRNIGVRYKGSIGAWVGCLSNNNWAEPSGYKTCPKLSMKIKINWSDDKKFYGINKLQFHSQNLDPTKMHERLGYYMFRNFGVTAPRSNHALIYINGEFNGVFANTEQIDGPFTNKHFDPSGGNLYKEVWPVKSNGKSQNEAYFQEALKTNEEISDVSKIKSFSDQLAAVGNSEAWGVVENWMNKELFLKMLVVDTRIANDDGLRHFYPDEYGLYANHNYYWYEDPNQDEIQFIPWDLDNAFDNLINDVNWVTAVKDEWYETSNNCKPFRHRALRQISPGCDKIIGSFSPFLDEYNELDVTFKNNLYNMSNINSLLDTWSNQIRGAVIEANEKYGNQELSLEEWTNYVNNLKNTISKSLN
jgi:spore coat protein CotH